MRFGVALAGISLVMGSALGLAAPPKVARPARAAKSAADPQQIAYQQQVAPELKKYCGACHGEAVKTAGISVTAYHDVAAVVKDRSSWEKISHAISAHQMPPKGAPQPTPKEREKLATWIDVTLSTAACDIRDPGRVTLRRLNRAEYNNTIRDLVGVDFKPAADFPSDDVGYGFDNIGDVLTISPLLAEKYLSAAEKVAETAVVTDPAGGPVRRFEADHIPETGGDGFVSGPVRRVVSNGEVNVDFDFPKAGDYVLRSRAYEEHAGTEAAKMAFRIDGKDLQTVDVSAVQDMPKVYEVKANVPAGKHRFAVAFTNDFNSRFPRADRNLIVDYLEIVGPLDMSQQLPESHRRIFIVKPEKGKELDAARTIMANFARRAYRRPVRPEEVDRLVKVVDMAMKEGDSFEKGIQLAVEATLVSPNFLFRVEADPPTPAAKTAAKTAREVPARPLNDWELASRLSYFLWASMPDDRLFDLAEEGQLHKPEVLAAEAKRMIYDPKAHALVDNFGDEWLHLRLLRNVNPDAKQFPQFNDDLRRAMQTETEMFFESVVKEDRSILDFIDGKYSYLNEPLAKLYGIDWVQGPQFRKVVMVNGPRSGVITQASVLTITSNPTRTSPVKRGKWVLEQIFGTPPPPPPPDVPPLPEGAMLTGTLRQRLEKHRENPVCASCHARMDPIGFGLENFDAIGRWRDKDGDAPVDSVGTLTTGQSFNGPAELKGILKAQKQAFARNFVSQLMTYALGRGLDYHDKCTLDSMTSAVARNGYKFSAVVTEIVQSDSFRKRRVVEEIAQR